MNLISFLDQLQHDQTHANSYIASLALVFKIQNTFNSLYTHK